MYLYVCVFDDDKHLKIGICEDFQRINILTKYFRFNLHKSILVSSKKNSLIRLLEKILLSVTQKFYVEKLEGYKLTNSNIGLTEVRFIESLQIVEQTLNMFCSFHLDTLTFYRCINYTCSHCDNTTWNAETVSLEDIMISKLPPIIKQFEKKLI